MDETATKLLDAVKLLHALRFDLNRFTTREISIDHVVVVARQKARIDGNAFEYQPVGIRNALHGLERAIVASKYGTTSPAVRCSISGERRLICWGGQVFCRALY